MPLPAIPIPDDCAPFPWLIPSLLKNGTNKGSTGGGGISSRGCGVSGEMEAERGGGGDGEEEEEEMPLPPGHPAWIHRGDRKSAFRQEPVVVTRVTTKPKNAPIEAPAPDPEEQARLDRLAVTNSAKRKRQQQQKRNKPQEEEQSEEAVEPPLPDERPEPGCVRIVNKDVLTLRDRLIAESVIERGLDAAAIRNVFVPLNDKTFGTDKRAILSMRTIQDDFLNGYAAEHPVSYPNPNGSGGTFQVHEAYQEQIQHYKKEKFDIFKRGDIIWVDFGGERLASTTIAQANCVTWLIRHGVLDWMIAHQADILEYKAERKRAKSRKRAAAAAARGGEKGDANMRPPRRATPASLPTAADPRANP